MPTFSDENIIKLFGIEDAENESPERLKEYFFRNKAYENLSSSLPIRILIGHKGVGKSALLKMTHLEDQEAKVMSLWLRPDDVYAAVGSGGKGDFNAQIDKWKRALSLLIAKHIIREFSNEAAEAADAFLAERQSGLVTNITSVLRDYFVARKKKALDSTKEAIIAAFLKNNTIRIYLDDLDRGWQARKEDIQNISALLNAIRDLCGNKSTLQFRLGLRTDVYYLVRTSDESTDKIERHLIFLTWTHHEILTLAAKRVGTFFGEQVDQAKLITRPQIEIARQLHRVIDPVFLGVGKWENAPIHRVLLSLIRKRPRDLVKLMHGAAKEAYKKDHDKISSSDLQATFESYSNERLQDIANEFKTELPLIANLVRGMRPAKREHRTAEQYVYSNADLSKKLKNLMQQNRFEFTNRRPITASALGHFLYKIDFIMGRKELPDGSIVRKYFDQNQYLKDELVDFGFDWEVHPAYRWALQPADAKDLYKTIALAVESND